MRWLPFPLHPEVPAEGAHIHELFVGREAYIDAMRDRLRSAFLEEGLPHGSMDRTFNTRLAQELAEWAADGQPGGDGLHDALFRAVFVDSRNIGDLETLVAIADEVGVDIDAARDVLVSRSRSDDVDRGWRRARASGVTGVPTFVAGGRGVVGAQPLPILRDLVESAGAKRR